LREKNYFNINQLLHCGLELEESNKKKKEKKKKRYEKRKEKIKNSQESKAHDEIDRESTRMHVAECRNLSRDLIE
jgi:hypothetical protein